MKIGVCASPDKARLVSYLGYDYLEAEFAKLAALDENAFREQTALLERACLPAEAFCIFFTGANKLYAKDGEQEQLLRDIADYAERGFSRAAEWGGKIAVIGSGDARRIPDDMTREEIEPQFCRVLCVCGEAAERHGMKIVVEPLWTKACNFINTVAEGAAVARLAGHSAVGLLADFYHMAKNGDDVISLPQYADVLWHVHYGGPEDRGAPVPGDGEILAKFADVLRGCPEAVRISLECYWRPDFDTAITAARPLMEVFKTNTLK